MIRDEDENAAVATFVREESARDPCLRIILLIQYQIQRAGLNVSTLLHLCSSFRSLAIIVTLVAQARRQSIHPVFVLPNTLPCLSSASKQLRRPVRLWKTTGLSTRRHYPQTLFVALAALLRADSSTTLHRHDRLVPAPVDLVEVDYP